MNKLTKAQEKRFEELKRNCTGAYNVSLPPEVKQHLADELALQRTKVSPLLLQILKADNDVTRLVVVKMIMEELEK